MNEWSDRFLPEELQSQNIPQKGPWNFPMMKTFVLRLDMVVAKKLKSAMGKVTFDRLTKAESDAVAEFLTDLIIGTQPDAY